MAKVITRNVTSPLNLDLRTALSIAIVWVYEWCQFSARTVILYFVLMLEVLFMSATVSAEDRSVSDCYAQKDQACLKAIFSDVVANPSPEKSKAMYLLGLLQLEEGKDYKAAKDSFVMSIMFGKTDNDKAHKRLLELYQTGKVGFDPSECLMIEEEACFEQLIQGDDPKKVRNAQYLFGTKLYETDPKRSYQLLLAAFDAGHQTASCELQKFYEGDGADEVPMDYHKFVAYGLDCLFKPPFKKFNKKHFAKYENKKSHKAYVHVATGYGNYAYGMTSPEFAASVAIEYCKAFSKRKTDDPKCKIINIDGKWVKDPVLIDLPESASSIKDLVSTKALNSYEKKYSKEDNPKIFVQSKIGAWQWYSKGDTDQSLEEMKKKALSVCNNSSTVKKTGHACKVININGNWVN